MTTDTLEARDKQPVEAEWTRPGPVFRPDVDVLERPDGYVIFADLPGADETSVDIKLEQGVLTLDAQLPTFPSESWTQVHAEYRSGSYHREFRLSKDIDAAAVSAKMRDGVLELHLPKSSAARKRSITVQAA